MTADKKIEQLRVEPVGVLDDLLHLEPWFVGHDEERFYASLTAALTSFRDFNGCDEITVERADPPEAADRLRCALRAER